MWLGIDFLTLTRTVLPDCRIVFTFHEYMTMCDAQGHMVRWTDGSLCSHPSPVRCHQCRPEYPPEHFLMRQMWFMRHLSVVDRFACASRFQIEHFAAWGIDRSKIIPGSERPVQSGPRHPAARPGRTQEPSRFLRAVP